MVTVVNPSDAPNNKQELDAISCTVCNIPNGQHSVKELIACKSAIEILYGRLIQTVRVETENIKEKLKAIEAFKGQFLI